MKGYTLTSQCKRNCWIRVRLHLHVFCQGAQNVNHDFKAWSWTLNPIALIIDQKCYVNIFGNRFSWRNPVRLSCEIMYFLYYTSVTIHVCVCVCERASVNCKLTTVLVSQTQSILWVNSCAHIQKIPTHTGQFRSESDWKFTQALLKYRNSPSRPTLAMQVQTKNRQQTRRMSKMQLTAPPPSTRVTSSRVRARARDVLAFLARARTIPERLPRSRRFLRALDSGVRPAARATR